MSPSNLNPYYEKEMPKKDFTEPELRAIAAYVYDVARLCALDDDLDVEIGADTERILGILGLKWPTNEEEDI
jgi:hypothetical protein